MSVKWRQHYQKTKQAYQGLQPTQVGVAVPKATEQVPMLFQGAINKLALSHPDGDWVLLQVALKNAFNSLSGHT